MAAKQAACAPIAYGLTFLLTFGLSGAVRGQDGQPLRVEPVPGSTRLDSGFCLSAARAALARGNLDEAEAWALQAEKAPMRFHDWVKSCLSNASVKIWREIQIARTKEITVQIDELERQEISKPTDTPEPDLLTDGGNRRVAEPQAKDIAALQHQFFAITDRPIVFKADLSSARGVESKRLRPDSPLNRDDMSRLAAYLQKNHASYLQKTTPPGPQASSEELLAHACYAFLHGKYQNAKTLGQRARAVDQAADVVTTASSQNEGVVAESDHTAPIVEGKREKRPITWPSGPTGEEESEPNVQPVKSRTAPSGLSGWFVGIGVALGMLLVMIFRKNASFWFGTRAGRTER